MSFFRLRRRNRNDERRQREIDAIYNVNQDVPTTFSSDMGSINWDRQPGTHSYNFKANSPLIAQNTQNQLALGNQNADLIEQSRLATSDNPEQSRYFNAFKQQFENEYERLRGQQATRMSQRQNNALGNITNNQVQQQLASYKGTMPYMFNSTVLQPMIGQTAGLQNSLQQNSNSVLGGLLSGFNAGQSTYENEIARRMDTQRYEQNRLNQNINRRTTIRDVMGKLADTTGNLFGIENAGSLYKESYLPENSHLSGVNMQSPNLSGMSNSDKNAIRGAIFGNKQNDPSTDTTNPLSGLFSTGGSGGGSGGTSASILKLLMGGI